MSQARKKKSREEIRRRKRNREESQRIASRQDDKRPKDNVQLSFLLRKYKVEFLLISFVIIGIFFVMSLGPDQRAIKELENSFKPFLYSQSWKWDTTYSKGYKIIALRNEDIIQTTFDTLPTDIYVNWKKMSVARIQTTQLDSTFEKIKITLPDIRYQPANMFGVTASAVLSSQIGSSAVLANLGKTEFVIEIVEINENATFCLIGLKDQ